MLIEFKRPQLEDREVISEYFWNYPSRSCDRTFVNGFLWSRFYNGGFAVIEDTLVFEDELNGWSRFYNGGFAVIEDTLVFEDELNGQYSYSYPAGTPENIKKAILCLEEQCREKGIPLALHAVTPDQFAQLEQLFPGKFQIEYNRDWADYVYESEKQCREKGIPLALHAVTPDQFAQLEQLFPGKFQIEYNRDWADYVYESEKLATLSGKKLHSKRNHVNRFMATHDNWTYEKLTKENVEECFQMALLWRKENGCDDEMRTKMKKCA